MTGKERYLHDLWMLLVWLFITISACWGDESPLSPIHDIERGISGEDTLIFLSSGSVVKLDDSISSLQWDELYRLKEERTPVSFEVDEDRRIRSWRILPSAPERNEFGHKVAPSTYLPTVFSSVPEARGFLHSMNPEATPKAECYNRAHVWTFEGSSKLEVKSMKIWLFFTKKYIREHNFEWWFHVSPFTYVREDGTIKERTLDRKYARDPLLIKDWTDIFMRNRATCPLVKRYSDYRQNQEAESCFVMKTNMYYYQPLDLERLERRGVLKSGWLNWELRNAYRQGFGKEQGLEILGN